MEYLDYHLPDGRRVAIYTDSDRVYITSLECYATAGGSPTTVTLDPPIGPVSGLSLGDLYQLIVSSLPS